MAWIGPVRSVVLAAAVCGLASTVEASTIIDLTAGGSGTSNGAIYSWTDYQPTGSGVIDSFLRVQNRGTEQGYNHSLGHKVPWDTKPGSHTHDVQMEDLVVRNITGVDYYEFLLDVNESSGRDRELINLDNIQLYTRSSPITSPDESLSHLGTLRYNNDVGPNGDTTVVLDYSLNSGSGSGDMFFYVPVSLFAGTLPTDYLYFYSLFSNSEAGFEEWAMLQQTGPGDVPVIPEPGTMLLMGTGLALAARRRLRKTA